LADSQQKDENNDEVIQKQKLKLKNLQSNLEKAESELVKSKQKLGEVINIVMETGQTDLVDQIYSVMGRGN